MGSHSAGVVVAFEAAPELDDGVAYPVVEFARGYRLCITPMTTSGELGVLGECLGLEKDCERELVRRATSYRRFFPKKVSTTNSDSCRPFHPTAVPSKTSDKTPLPDENFHRTSGSLPKESEDIQPQTTSQKTNCSNFQAQ